MSDNKMESKSESPTKKLTIFQNLFGTTNLGGDKNQNKRQSYSVLQPNERDAYIEKKQFVKDPNRRYKTQYANKQQQCFNWARYIQMSVTESKSTAISKLIQNNIDKFSACIIYSSQERVNLLQSQLSSAFRNNTIAINSKQNFKQSLRKAQKQNIRIIIINSIIVSESMRKTNDFSLPSAVNFILFDQICHNRMIFEKMISKSAQTPIEPGVIVNFVYAKIHSINLLTKQEETVFETFTKQKKYTTTYLRDSQKKHYDLSQYFAAKQNAFSQKQQHALNINEQLSQTDSNTRTLRKITLSSKSEILQGNKGQKSIIEEQQDNSQEIINVPEYDQLGKYIVKYIGKHIKTQFKLNIREEKQRKNKAEIQQIKQYIEDSENRNQKFIQKLKDEEDRRKDINRYTLKKLQQKIQILQQQCKRIIKQRDNSNDKLSQYVVKLNDLENKLYNENFQKKKIESQKQDMFREMIKYKSLYHHEQQLNKERKEQIKILVSNIEHHAKNHSLITIELNNYKCLYQEGKTYLLSYLLQSEKKRKTWEKKKREKSTAITFGLNRIKSSSSAKNEEQQQQFNQYKQQIEKKSIKELIEKCIKNSNKQTIQLMYCFIRATSKMEQEKITSKVIQNQMDVNDKYYGQKKNKIMKEYFSGLKVLQKVIEDYNQYRKKQNKKKQRTNKDKEKVMSINSEQEYEKIQNLKKEKQVLQQNFSNCQKQVTIFYQNQLKIKDEEIQDLKKKLDKLKIEIETAGEQKKQLIQSHIKQVSQLQQKLKLKQENTVKELIMKQQQISYLQRSHKQTVQQNLKQFQQKTTTKENQYQQRINQGNNQRIKLNNEIIRLSNQITRLNKQNQNKINELCFSLNKLRQILDHNFEFFNVILKKNLKIQLNFTIDNYQNKSVQLQKSLPIVLEKCTFLIQSELYRKMNEQRKKFIYDSIKSLVPKKIVYTKTLFEGYPGTTWDHWLLKVGNKPNLLMLLRLKNGFEIAGFSENPFSKEPCDRGKGFIMSVTNLKLYNLKRGYEGKVAKYDQYIFGMGNNELLVKNNFKFNIIISRAYCHFDTANVESIELIGEDNDEGEFDRVEFYQLINE